jgi:hypothetical protein
VQSWHRIQGRKDEENSDESLASGQRAETLQAIGRMKTETLAHPSYSPPMSQGGFGLFEWAKTAL